MGQGKSEAERELARTLSSSTFTQKNKAAETQRVRAGGQAGPYCSFASHPSTTGLLEEFEEFGAWPGMVTHTCNPSTLGN
ncbi:hypothetical protein AAY473_034845 [Plecturocebus cupreus]